MVCIQACATNGTTELFQVSLCKTFRSASESMKCVQQRLPHFMSLISIAQKKPWLHAQESPVTVTTAFWIFGTGSYSRRNALPSGTVRLSNFPLFIFSEGVSAYCMDLHITSVFDQDPVKTALWHIKYMCTGSGHLTHDTAVGRIH